MQRRLKNAGKENYKTRGEIESVTAAGYIENLADKLEVLKIKRVISHGKLIIIDHRADENYKRRD